MTLVLHIGSHKTGTTAVQRFAAAHRAILRERGLWYPSYDEIGLPEHYAHHHFAHAIADAARGKFDIGDAERFSAAVRRGRRKGETVLLSAEPIYRHVLKGPDDYWAQREAYVARLKEMIGTDDATVLADDHVAADLERALEATVDAQAAIDLQIAAQRRRAPDRPPHPRRGPRSTGRTPRCSGRCRPR